MGVDAEMFAKIKGRANWLKDEDELSAAVELAQVVGHEPFFINRGEPKTYGETHHALSIVRPLKDEKDCEDNGLDARSVGHVVWTQDGPDIIAAEDEQFIKVHLWTRYYGEEYARGNWPTIRATAEWLEHRFKGCEVWYGGDSSGICAEHLTRARRDELNAFYLDSGRKTYTRSSAWSDFGGLGGAKCPCCEIAMMNKGGGGRGADAVSFLYCDGCGKKLVKHASGQLEWLERGKDFFERPSSKTATQKQEPA